EPVRKSQVAEEVGQPSTGSDDDTVTVDDVPRRRGDTEAARGSPGPLGAGPIGDEPGPTGGVREVQHTRPRGPGVADAGVGRPRGCGIEGELAPAPGRTRRIDDLMGDADRFEDLGKLRDVPGIAVVDGSGASDQLGA